MCASHPASSEVRTNLRIRLAKCRVGIVGLGGLGSNVAWMLARSGVGTLVLADHDVVDQSNLDRQFYFADQVGLPKTDALATNLGRITGDVSLEIHHAWIDESNLARIFVGVDVFVEAADSAESKAMLVATASDQLPGIPIVSASGLAGYGSANDIVTRNVAGLWMVGDLVTAACEEHPLFASRVTVAAAHEAHIVVRLLLGYPQA
jgi:sulfur carrier protein ThiS adenylyltransferase